MDNCTEYLYQGSELNAYIHTRGGSLFELDFLPGLDELPRHDEPAGRGRARARVPRKAFLDHFLRRGLHARGRSMPTGSDEPAGTSCAGLYEVVELNRSLPEVLLRRSGQRARRRRRPASPCGIDKRYVFRPRSIDVYYELSGSTASAPCARGFGVEINVSLAARSPESGRLFILGEDRKTEIGLDGPRSPP